jgi:Ran GTPase-activating protein (RanGAP) involved in mRNA processing and transport
MESSKFTVPKGKIYNTAEDCAELISSLNSLTNLEILELSGASFGFEACKKIAENLHNHPEITVRTGYIVIHLTFRLPTLRTCLQEKRVTKSHTR